MEAAVFAERLKPQSSLTVKHLVLGRMVELDSHLWLFPCVLALIRTLGEKTGVSGTVCMIILACMGCHSAWSMTGEACVVEWF